MPTPSEATDALESFGTDVVAVLARRAFAEHMVNVGVIVWESPKEADHLIEACGYREALPEMWGASVFAGAIRAPVSLVLDRVDQSVFVGPIGHSRSLSLSCLPAMPRRTYT